MNHFSCQIESLAPMHIDATVSRPKLTLTRKRSVDSNSSKDGTPKKPISCKRSKSLPTHLLPEHAGKPLFWFLAKDQENMMLSNSSLCMEAVTESSVSGDTPNEATLLNAWVQQKDDTEDMTMELSCTLSISTHDCSFLNASDALLGLDFVMQDEVEDEDGSDNSVQEDCSEECDVCVA